MINPLDLIGKKSVAIKGYLETPEKYYGGEYNPKPNDVLQAIVTDVRTRDPRYPGFLVTSKLPEQNQEFQRTAPFRGAVPVAVNRVTGERREGFISGPSRVAYSGGRPYHGKKMGDLNAWTTEWIRKNSNS